MSTNTFVLFFVIISTVACNDEKIAPSGMVYKITNENSKNEEFIKEGQFVKLNIEYKLKSKDSILSTTFAKLPLYFQVEKFSNSDKYSFTELLPYCKNGDKISFYLRVDSLIKFNKNGLSGRFESNDIIIGRAEILNVFDYRDLVDADYQIELSKFKNIANKSRNENYFEYLNLSYTEKINRIKLQAEKSIFIVSEENNISIPDFSIFFILTDSISLDSLHFRNRFNFPILVRFSDRNVKYSGNSFEDGGLDRKSVGAAYDYGKYESEGYTRDIQIFETDQKTGNTFSPVSIGYVTNNLGGFELFDFKEMTQLQGLPKSENDYYDILNYLGKISDDISDNIINLKTSNNFLYYSFGRFTDKFSGKNLARRKK